MSLSLILSQKGRDVVTSAPHRTVREVAQTLHEKSIGAVVVTGADGIVLGIFSERDVVRALAAREIPAKPYFPAIHLMSFYRETFGHREGQFPVCEDVSARSIALPFFPAMSEGQVDRVASELAAVLGQAAR